MPAVVDLEAVEAVCSDDQVPRNEVLDALSRLVDKSLVTVEVGPTTARYSQLQTLWQYAREHLADSGEMDEMQARHAGWYLELAKEGRSNLRGPMGIEWRARLEVELDNFRAGLDWFIGRRDAPSALALVGAVAYLWFLPADPTKATDGRATPWPLTPRTHVEGVFVDMPPATGPTSDAVLGPAAALDAMQQAISDLPGRPARPIWAGGLLLLAEILTRLGDFEGSQAVLAEALPLARKGTSHGTSPPTTCSLLGTWLYQACTSRATDQLLVHGRGVALRVSRPGSALGIPGARRGARPAAAARCRLMKAWVLQSALSMMPASGWPRCEHDSEMT